MPEPADSSLSRRGAWIGLRTLRQRPKIVDHTSSGEPIFEVRSVRLLLQPDADHFNRLETCSKCGRNVAGGPVFDLGDLDRPSNPLICTTCVHAVAKPTLLRSGGRRPAPEPPAAPGKPVDTPAAVSDSKAAGADRPGPAAVDDAALAAKGVVAQDDIRRELQTVTGLLEAQKRDLGALSDAVRKTRTELGSLTESQERLTQSQQELHERTAAFAQERSEQAASDGTTSSQVERDLRHNLQFVTELLQAQQRELSALSTALVETRNDLQAVTESQQTLARSQQDLDRRLAGLPPPDPLGAEHAQRAESLERGLEDLSARLAEGLARARAETTDLVGKLRREVGALAQAVEAQRHQFEAAEDAGARAQLSGLDQAVAGLRTASSAHDDRLEALEDELNDLAIRLSSLIDAERAAFPTPKGDEAAGLPGRVAGGALLDALDRQLRDAEGRLARLSTRSRSTPAE
jgi:two-component sensor histidine kinase